MTETQRLFFAFQAECAWPQNLPNGRLLAENERHMTLVFLGDCKVDSLLQALPNFPKPPFPLALTGYFDAPLLLPSPLNPHVAAWQVNLLNHAQEVSNYYQTCAVWLHEQGFLKQIDSRPFLPHVTLARSPLEAPTWLQEFKPIPVVFPAFHLYRSLGSLCYQTIWSHSFHPTFEVIEHTADLAFRLYGQTVQEIGLHALAALWSESPELINQHEPMAKNDYQTIESVVSYLNRLISRVDRSIGTRLKAVSYHGEIQPGESGYLEWEMIVDV